MATKTDKRIEQYLAARKAGDLATMSRIQDGLKGRELTVLARALKAAGPAPVPSMRQIDRQQTAERAAATKATDTTTPNPAAGAAKETPVKTTKAIKAAAKATTKAVKAAVKAAPKAAATKATDLPHGAKSGSGPKGAWREVAKVLAAHGAVRSIVKLAECGHVKLCRKGRVRVVCPVC